MDDRHADPSTFGVTAFPGPRADGRWNPGESLRAQWAKDVDRVLILAPRLAALRQEHLCKQCRNGGCPVVWRESRKSALEQLPERDVRGAKGLPCCDRSSGLYDLLDVQLTVPVLDEQWAILPFAEFRQRPPACRTSMPCIPRSK